MEVFDEDVYGMDNQTALILMKLILILQFILLAKIPSLGSLRRNTCREFPKTLQESWDTESLDVSEQIYGMD